MRHAPQIRRMISNNETQFFTLKIIRGLEKICEGEHGGKGHPDSAVFNFSILLKSPWLDKQQSRQEKEKEKGGTNWLKEM